MVRLCGGRSGHSCSLVQKVQTHQFSHSSRIFHLNLILSFASSPQPLLPPIIFCEDYSVLRVLFPFSFAGSNGIDFILVSILTAIAS